MVDPNLDSRFIAGYFSIPEYNYIREEIENLMSHSAFWPLEKYIHMWLMPTVMSI